MDQYTIKVLCRKEWEAGVQHGIACEQQRIIKLLQNQAVLCGRSGSQGHGLRCALRIVEDGCNCNEVIALIKGEK
jgi:hypothetical protein